MVTNTAPGAEAPALVTVVVRWMIAVVALVLISLAHIRYTGVFTLADVFLLQQDWIALALIAACLLALTASPRGAEFRLAGWMRSAWTSRVIVWGTGGLVLLAGSVGWGLVFGRYPLSLDEFWARFDAQIFARGHLLAELPNSWRPFAAALQPMWRMETAGDSHWASLYLPMNAAFRALFVWAHAEALASALWAALACILTYVLARRLWPQRRDAAVVATVLVGASSQVLVTAMTPYAMSAHLALNLMWLVLFLDDRPWSRFGALVVGFLACGIHQLPFHPLFAAPFILELWLARRWKPALLYTAGYALICVFWTAYWSLLLRAAHVAPAAAHGVGAQFLVLRVEALLQDFGPVGAGLMAKNLLRMIAWQHPLALPLLMLALPGAALAQGPLRPMVWGLALTLLTMFVLIPDQGLGWGYRYLHGLLGSVALIGAQGWIRLTGEDGRRAWAAPYTAFAVATATAVLVLLPLHLWQAYSYARPYALAEAAIQTADADVVVVDDSGLRLGIDLVRNDPFLEHRPKVVRLRTLTLHGLELLCRSGTVALFDRREGRRLGIPAYEEGDGAGTGSLRAMLADPAQCHAMVLSGGS